MFKGVKPGGLFHLSMSDYNCGRTNKKVIARGHVWFPVFNSVKSLLESTNFLTRFRFKILH
tara:strand:+ start:14024 stop:14206 length:183 start_codon:yes stop_codon:yes gene_type:complete